MSSSSPDTGSSGGPDSGASAAQSAEHAVEKVAEQPAGKPAEKTGDSGAPERRDVGAARRPKAALIFDDPLDQQSSDDTDRGWGERPRGEDSAADLRRFLDEKPPHHL